MVEKLEQENGSYFVRDVEYFKDNRYIYQPHGKVLNYTHRYWYDGGLLSDRRVFLDKTGSYDRS